MKKLLLSFILLNTIVVFSQTDADSLKIDIKNAIKAYNEKDYEAVLNYFPDFVFDNISKEKVLEQISNNPNSKAIKIPVIKIDTIITIGSVKYARFYMDSKTLNYGIKTENNKNWTYIDPIDEAIEYIPIQIRASN